jgi:hypothetical protein
VLFLFAAVVQYNDPDPVRWMAIYLAASATSIAAARGSRMPIAVPLVVAAIAVVWGLMLASGNRSLGVYASMFSAWEMRSVPIEEARESSGLLIVAVWMTVVALRIYRQTARRS